LHYGANSFKNAAEKLTCRQHCRTLNLEKPPALMRSKAFQKSPRCWRPGDWLDELGNIMAFTNKYHR
jgi:hypothetical protein